ncbi:topoisomerase IV subunit B [Escherichia coli]|nr:topoisomerase IV subunit B [Escherichia coli]
MAVGISVVNALSKRVEVNVRRDGQVYNIAFENGEKVQDLQVVGTCGKRNTGTSVHFWPDETFFDSPRFSVFTPDTCAEKPKRYCALALRSLLKMRSTIPNNAGAIRTV